MDLGKVLLGLLDVNDEVPSGNHLGPPLLVKVLPQLLVAESTPTSAVQAFANLNRKTH